MPTITAEDITVICEALEASKNDLDYTTLDKTIAYLKWMKGLPPQPVVKVKKVRSKRIRRAAYAQGPRREFRRDCR
jgi:hypothetical protein